MGIAQLFGGIGGRPGKSELSRERTEYGTAVADRVQPARTSSLQLMEELKAQAEGRAAPSFAQKNLVAANQRSLAQTLAAAAAQRGAPVGAVQRKIQQQRGAAQRNLAQQGQMLEQVEKSAAQAQLADLTQQQQEQSLQQIMQPGGLSAAAAQTRFEEDQKREEENRKRVGKEMGAVLGTVGGIVGGIAGGYFTGGTGAVGGATAGYTLGNTIGNAAGESVSDERVKKGVESAKKDVRLFLDALSAHKYEYKNPNQTGAAPGQRIGVMAQDLEKSTLGKTLVRNTPEGKKVDTVQGFGALLASQAELHERLKKLEKKGK